MKKKLIALILCAAMIFGLAACGGNTNTANTASNTENGSTGNEVTNTVPEPAGEKVLTIAHKGKPTGLCISTVNFTSNNGPVDAIYGERLVKFDSDTGEYKPWLATKWEYVDDTHIRFTLRDDVLAQDGKSKFKASDVVYTIKTNAEIGKLPSYTRNLDPDNCVAEDDTHVIVALKVVDPFAISNLANVPMSMMVEEAVKATGGLDAQGTMPRCYTGPYTVTSAGDTQIVLERNETYWGEKPYYDKVVVKIITDASARAMALEAKEVDIALEPDLNQIGLIQGKPEYSVLEFETPHITLMHLNCSKAPFDDVNFRRAVALALEYESNIQVALNGFGTTTDSLIPKKNPMYAKPDGTTLNFFHTDLEEAKKYLAQSKYPNGTTFELKYGEGAAYDAMGVLIQQQLAKLNIKVDIKPVQLTTFNEDCSTGNFVAGMMNASNPDPAVIVRYFDGRLAFNQNNRSGWQGTQELYDLMDKAYVELDDAKKAEYYKQIQAILNENVPNIALYSPKKIVFTNSAVKGMKLTVFNDPDVSGCYQ